MLSEYKVNYSFSNEVNVLLLLFVLNIKYCVYLLLT